MFSKLVSLVWHFLYDSMLQLVLYYISILLFEYGITRQSVNQGFESPECQSIILWLKGSIFCPRPGNFISSIFIFY